MVFYTDILSLALYGILYTEIAPKFLGLFKLSYNMLGMRWTCIACTLMLLAVVIVLINVFNVWISKLKWKAQKSPSCKAIFVIFHKEKKNSSER